MTDWISSHLSGQQFGVQAGAGDQYNNYFLPPNDQRTRSPLRQAADELLWLDQRFVHPPGFRKAREVLRTDRTVFLDAEPGSGRIATAKMLLWELGHDTEQIHELLPPDDGSARLDTSDIADGDRAWLDLSDSAGRIWPEVQAIFSSLRSTVHACSAYLVVVLPSRTRDLEPQFGQWRVWIDRPPVLQVLRRHLRAADIQPTPSHPVSPDGGTRPLRDIARYAGLIREARDKAPDDGDLASWCATAYRALSGHREAVAELMAATGEGAQRALLLATAMLHGAHADSVVSAADSLLHAAGHPGDERQLLERDALGLSLGKINAELDARGRVRFKQLGYDAAVRTYFWTHMPHLHHRLSEWVRQLVDAPALTSEEREHLVTRFAEYCTNERYLAVWVPLVEQWTSEPTESRVRASAQILKCGLQNVSNGRTFRRQIYDWATKRKVLSGALVEVIVAACRDQMAVTHPDEALVRLHHVARREQGTRARQVLVALVAGNRRSLRQMLRRLTDPQTKPWERDTDLFLDIADPQLLTDLGHRDIALIAGQTVRSQLADGWSMAFARPSPESWRPQAQQWLHHAAEDGQHRHMLLDVLVEGAKENSDALGTLYTLTRRPVLRTAISDLFLQKIGAAQGFQPV